MNLKSLIGTRMFYRKLFAIMVPILIQTIITNFVSLLDNVMVGQVGTEPMSGVAIVNQLMFVFNLCIFGGLAGAGIFTAQYYGNGDYEGVANTFRAKLYIGLCIAASFILVFAFAGETLIKTFIHEGGEQLDMAATLEYGKSYLRIVLLQIPPFALQQVYSSTLRESGETVLPMKAGLAAFFVNLIGNYILIFGKLGAPVMGVRGAAIATLIARFVECGIIVLWTHSHRERNRFINFAYTSFRIPARLLRQIIVMGMPLMINELLWSGGQTVLNQCYSMRGLEVVSAVNISSTVSELFFSALMAMGNSISIIIGQLLGAGELERAVEEDRQLIAFSIVMCTVVGAIMALLAPVIPLLYNTSDNVRHIATQLLVVTSSLMPIHAFVNASYFTLRSGGKTIITFIFDSFYLWIMCIPLAFILSRYTAMPILKLYIIVQVMDMSKAFLGFFLLRQRKWVNDLAHT